jgi:cell division initiation protein
MIMDLTPNDIRNYDFPGALRGYDKDKVDEFVEQVATVLEEAKQETLKLSMELDSVRGQLSGLKQFEDTIKNAAIDSRRNADMLLSSAKAEAESILNDARNVVQKTVDEHRARITDVEEKVHQLEVVKKSYLTKIKALIASHMELVDEVGEMEMPQLDTSGLDVTDTAAVDDKVHETHVSETAEPVPLASTTPASAPVAEEKSPEEEGGSDAQEYKIPVNEDAESDSQEEPPTEKLDPELAAALAGYHADEAVPKLDKAVVQPEETMVQAPPVPPPPAVVETNSLAEDIPAGFVTKDGIPASPRPSANMPLESNSVDIDADVNKPVEKPTEDILSTLDEVASKVDELDKAEKK